jgi:hypothetical protein
MNSPLLCHATTSAHQTLVTRFLPRTQDIAFRTQWPRFACQHSALVSGSAISACDERARGNPHGGNAPKHTAFRLWDSARLARPQPHSGPTGPFRPTGNVLWNDAQVNTRHGNGITWQICQQLTDQLGQLPLGQRQHGLHSGYQYAHYLGMPTWRRTSREDHTGATPQSIQQPLMGLGSTRSTVAPLGPFLGPLRPSCRLLWNVAEVTTLQLRNYQQSSY